MPEAISEDHLLRRIQYNNAVASLTSNKMQYDKLDRRLHNLESEVAKEEDEAKRWMIRSRIRECLWDQTQLNRNLVAAKRDVDFYGTRLRRIESRGRRNATRP